MRLININKIACDVFVIQSISNASIKIINFIKKNKSLPIGSESTDPWPCWLAVVKTTVCVGCPNETGIDSVITNRKKTNRLISILPQRFMTITIWLKKTVKFTCQLLHFKWFGLNLYTLLEKLSNRQSLDLELCIIWQTEFNSPSCNPLWCGLAVATVLPVAPVNDSEIGWASPGIWTYAFGWKFNVLFCNVKIKRG